MAKVAAVFAVLGVAWILGTDLAMYSLVEDPVTIARLETAKGWSFVATRTAGNGQQALEAAAQRKPAVVLLDMVMPVMGGWECTQKLRKR